MKKYTFGTLVALVAAAGVFAAQASAHHKPGHPQGTQGTQGQTKMWVCHRAGDNKYVAVRVSSRAAMRGHMRHGDVAVPAAQSMNKQSAQTFCNAQTITPRRGGSVLTGDLAGDALATIRISVGHRTLCFSFTNLPANSGFMLSHIHFASTGAIVPGLTLTTTGQTSGCLTGIDRDVLRAILQNPSAYLVNLHLANGTVILTAPLSR